MAHILEYNAVSTTIVQDNGNSYGVGWKCEL